MRHIAIIGSGPSGYYTAEALQKKYGDDVLIDIIDRLPVPYGLIRFGVAPDHQSIKAVTKRYEKTALTDNVRFVGNVCVGEDVTIDELKRLYDAVVLATGAPNDRKLDLPGAELNGVIGSAAFVGWYNGHPDFASLNPPLDGGNVVVIGNGNVALDVARMLAKTPEEFRGSDIVQHALGALGKARTQRIYILGRRGPHQIGMTPKELGELAHLERATPHVDLADLPPVDDDMMLEPGQRKSVHHLRDFAARHTAGDEEGKPIGIYFDFFASPVRFEGRDGRVDQLVVERTVLDSKGYAKTTGEFYNVPAHLVVNCIGYRTPPIPGASYDEAAGRFANDEGRMEGGLYVVGWARRGPTGTIGTNKPDGYMITEKIAEDIAAKPTNKTGRDGLDRLLKERSVKVVRFRDWQRLEEEEVRRALEGQPREKFVEVSDMLTALFGSPAQ